MARGGDETEHLEELLLGDIDYNDQYEVIISPDGTREVRRSEDGALHHPTEPSRISAEGTREWYLDNALDREEGAPTRVFLNGRREWHRNDLLHREGAPAVIDPELGIEEWFSYGEKSRYDGPSLTRDFDKCSSDLDALEEYWVDGRRRRSDKGYFQKLRDGTTVYFEGQINPLENKVLCLLRPEGDIEFRNINMETLARIDESGKIYYNDSLACKYDKTRCIFDSPEAREIITNLAQKYYKKNL